MIDCQTPIYSIRGQQIERRLTMKADYQKGRILARGKKEYIEIS
jgi:hypothetical protein